MEITAEELSEKANAIKLLFKVNTVSDEEIIRQIEETPELIHAKLPSTANLFIESVLWNRFNITKILVNMGSDIHLKCEPSLIAGNALNVAHSPGQADYLLDLGIEIEKNLSMKEAFRNPAISAVFHNDKTMVVYWINKQKELFPDEELYIQKLITAVIGTIAMMNQYDMLSYVLADEELYCALKEIYSKEEDVDSIKRILSALRNIKEEALESKKKELRKILNARKKAIV